MRGSRHPYVWWGRDHPLVVDGLITVLVSIFGVLTELTTSPQHPDVYRDANAYSVAVTLVATLPLVLRRRHPVVVYSIAYVMVFALGLPGHSGAGPWVATLIALYAVAAYSGRRLAVVCLVSSLLLGTLSVLLAPYEMEVRDIVVGSFALPLAAWLLGDNMRIRRDYVEAVEDRAAHLEREQDAQAKRAVVEERNRIARELHDIVAHSMSVMVVQAGGARRTLQRDPGRAAEAIGQIEATGRGALDEMRRLVGVLRRNDGDQDGSPDGEAELLPQPGIDRIPALVEQWRGAGLDAAFSTEGAKRPLPSGMELVVYRIVQEALTNVAKHAGPAATVQATLTYRNKAVTLEVADDGRGAAAGLVVEDTGVAGGGLIVKVAGTGVSTGSGHGLVGMAERVALYDGEMRWGPRRGGGFRVWAKLPLTGGAQTSSVGAS